MMIQELQELRLTHNQACLFSHRFNNKEPMRSETILQVIKRCGYAGRMTMHGFRALFSTVLNESNLISVEVIERQLAHVLQNRICSACIRIKSKFSWAESFRLLKRG